MLKIVIIEDEKLTAKDLQKTICSVHKDAEIVKIIGSVEEGLSFFSIPQQVDLVFSDIQLGDGLSFDIFESSNLNIPIVFCTAYDDYALQAFKNFGIEYVLKPFSKEAVLVALEKYEALTNKNVSKPLGDINALFQNMKIQLNPQTTTSILIYHGDKIKPIEVETIALLYIENEIVWAYTFDDKKHSTNQKLDKLEQSLFPKFFRANRQFLVHRNAIKEVSQHFHRKLLINLTIPFSESIVVGKEKVSSFLDWLTKQ